MNVTNMNYQILETISLNCSTAESWIRSRIVSGREGGGGSLRGSGLNQTNSMSMFNVYVESGKKRH
jgi:hypothetical protein